MINLENKVLSIKSSTDNLALVEGFVDEVCNKENIAEDFFGNILMAVTEAVTNAIQHGNKYDSTKEVEVSVVNANKEEIAFRIKDDGPGFNFNDLPDPTAPENIEKPNGRGIFLMKHLADQVTFNDQGRTVELKFKLSN